MRKRKNRNIRIQPSPKVPTIAKATTPSNILPKQRPTVEKLIEHARKSGVDSIVLKSCDIFSLLLYHALRRLAETSMLLAVSVVAAVIIGQVDPAKIMEVNDAKNQELVTLYVRSGSFLYLVAVMIDAVTESVFKNRR